MRRGKRRKEEGKKELKGTEDNTSSATHFDVVPASPAPIIDRSKGGKKGKTLYS